MKRFAFIVLTALAVFAVSYYKSTTSAQVRIGLPRNERQKTVVFAEKSDDAPQLNLPSSNLVISQVYGGGGVASTSPYRNDFVEIFNRGGAPVNLNGWSIQYSYADSTTWLATQLPNQTIEPGKYFLVQFAQSSGGFGAALPTPDATGTTNFNPNAGKVALVNVTATLPAGCPTSANVVDFVGYGATATCFEGSAPITGTNITNAVIRSGSGCQDTDQNSTDFTVATPAPRSSASAANNGCGTFATPLAGVGAANPSATSPGGAVLLTVRVTPADTPPSTGISVRVDLSNIGGASNQQFYDDGTNGDQTAGDNIFSFAYTISANSSGGTRNLPATITDQQNRTANATILLNINVAPTNDNPLLLGNPSNATPDTNQPLNYLMVKPQYTLSYNRDKGEANWVAWRLDTSWIGTTDRQDDFRPDDSLPAEWYRVTQTDYSGSGYDRGHMCPSGDRTRSVPDNSATFLMTNMIPQTASNNQGTWNELENYSRSLASAGNELYIMSGGAGSVGTIANGRVNVPAVTWKVIVVLPNGENDLARVSKQTRVIAVVVPNQGTTNLNWRVYRTTVRNVESLTGLNFLSNVPKAVQYALESRIDYQ